MCFFFFSSRRRHTRFDCDWSSDVCSSDLGEAALSTWLYAIATSVTLNGLRKLKRFRQRETDLDAAGGLGSRRREAEPDLKVRLARAIDDLPEGYRTVFLMHDVEGYTHEEIGQALGVETGTSKAQLSR